MITKIFFKMLQKVLIWFVPIILLLIYIGQNDTSTSSTPKTWKNPPKPIQPSLQSQGKRAKVYPARYYYSSPSQETTVEIKRVWGYRKDKVDVVILNPPTQEIDEADLMEAVDFYRD